MTEAIPQERAAALQEKRVPAWIEIVRPFTLVPTFLGIVSGSLAGLGSMASAGKMPFLVGLSEYWPQVLAGGVMASLLNSASNVLNQATEMEVDATNKPGRVLPEGRMSSRSAIRYAVGLYIAALLLAWWIEPQPGLHHTFWCALAAAAATLLYSVKPIYTKSRGWWANITIAIPRGCLLKVAGWGCVASVLDAEPWFIGAVFMLFFLGASSTKDFSDVEGDKEAGVMTLPVRYGNVMTAKLVSPFFVLPWILLLGGAFLPSFGAILKTGMVSSVCLSVALVAYGIYIARLMRHGTKVSLEGNHPAWLHMYLMMIVAQIGLVVCYLV